MKRLALLIVVLLLTWTRISLAAGPPGDAATPGAAAPASAQAEPEGEPGEDLDQVVQRHLQQGDALLQKGQAAEAAAAYQAAYELDPQSGTLFKLAEAQRQAGQLKQAARSYDRFLKEEKDPSSPSYGLRPQAEGHLKKIYARIRAEEEKATDGKVPVWKKAWFWGVIGGSVAVIGIGVGVGLAFGLRSENTIN